MKKHLINLIGAGMIALTGCQTANYTVAKVNAIPRRNIYDLERIAQQSIRNPMTLTSQTSGPGLEYEKSEQLSVIYSHLPAQKILVAYPDSRNPRIIETRILDTTGPLNAGGNDLTLMAMEQILSQVPEDALTAAYDLGQANRDTLSERTPGNQLSRNDGINLIQALSNSKCNNFRLTVKETSYTNLKLRDKDAYKVEIDFSQPEFRAKKKRKNLRFFGETALDALFASPAAFFATPYGWITPAVIVTEDAADGLVAYIESRKAPANALYSSNTDYITALPRGMSLTSSVLNNSARTQSREVTLVDLFDECDQPSGQGIVYTEGAYNIHTGPNCATFCLNKDRGSQLIRLIRRLSKVAPVIVEKTTTRDRVFESGGGRNGAPGENSHTEEFGGGRSGGGGENSFRGSRGAGNE